MTSTDGAMCHTDEVTLDVLRPVFEGRIISRKADVIRPCQLPFDTVGLLFVSCLQRKALRRQAIDTHTLKSRHTQDESLFGAEFGLEA